MSGIMPALQRRTRDPLSPLMHNAPVKDSHSLPLIFSHLKKNIFKTHVVLWLFTCASQCNSPTLFGPVSVDIFSPKKHYNNTSTNY